MRKLSRALVLVFITFLLAAQDISPETLAAIERSIKTQRAWGPKLNTPGAQLTAKETFRGSRDGHFLVSYEFYTSGMPTDEEYEFALSPVSLSDFEVRSTGDVLLDQAGLVVDGPDDPRIMVIPDALPGEPSRFALLSKDQRYKAFISLQPNPIRGSDHACQISITRLSPKFELAYLEGTGFPPQTEVDFASKSYDESKAKKVTTDDDGHFDMALLPAVAGKKEGDTEVQVTAVACKLKVKFHWGSKAK